MIENQKTQTNAENKNTKQQTEKNTMKRNKKTGKNTKIITKSQFEMKMR